MKISEEQLRSIIREKIKKVGNKYVVYPKKGGNRLGTHNTKKAAKKQLAAIEISKSKNESIDEAYVKRYVADSQGGVIRQELVDAPYRFNIDQIQERYEMYYNECYFDEVNSLRTMEGIGKLSYNDRKGLLDYIRELDGNQLYNVQASAYETARSLLERDVNELLQANPATASDYPGQGTKLVDATRRSQLFYTDNDIDSERYKNTKPDDIPWVDVYRVAMLDANPSKGVAPGAIQYHPEVEGQSDTGGIAIDAYVDMMAAQAREKTDPKQGSSVINTDIGSLKRPKSFVPDPDFVSTPIENDDTITNY